MYTATNEPTIDAFANRPQLPPPPKAVAEADVRQGPAVNVEHTTGTSLSVAAALEAIAQQNKSAVNSMPTATVLTAGSVTLRYVEPPPAFYENRPNYNHDKIVNFVGMGTKSYNLTF